MKWMFKEDHSLGKGGVILIRVIKNVHACSFYGLRGLSFCPVCNEFGV